MSGLLRFFKIRRRSDGLYSLGGSRGFGKIGKAWARESDVSSHLVWSGGIYDRHECDLITYEVVELERKPLEIVREERAIAEREREAEDVRKSELREMARLEELKKKYGL